MKQNRSKRIQLVVDLAHSAETQAARNLSEAQNQAEAEIQRLEDIQTYYSSYKQQFSEQTRTLRATDIANSHAFLSNLDRARQAQTMQVQLTEQQVERARQQWRTSHLKSDALESYQSRVAVDEEQAEEKQSQKMLDDLYNQKCGRTL